MQAILDDLMAFGRYGRPGRGDSPARRDQPRPQRGPAPRRSGGVRAPRARRAAPTPRGRGGAGGPRRPHRGLSRPLPARGHDEPLHLRLPRRTDPPVPLLPPPGRTLPEPPVGTAARPNRPERPGPRGALQGDDRDGARRGFVGGAPAGRGGARDPAGTQPVPGGCAGERAPAGPRPLPPLRPRPVRAPDSRRGEPAVPSQRPELPPADEGGANDCRPRRRRADRRRASRRSGTVPAGRRLR